jgi:hypothetical protein
MKENVIRNFKFNVFPYQCLNITITSTILSIFLTLLTVDYKSIMSVLLKKVRLKQMLQALNYKVMLKLVMLQALSDAQAGNATGTNYKVMSQVTRHSTRR